MATKYLKRSIQFWPDPNNIWCPANLWAGTAIEVEGDPISLVPGRPDWRSTGGFLATTSAGHRIFLPCEILSDRPPCRDCLEVRDGIDERGVCPDCREWAAMTPEQRAAAFA